jgi:chemotaxis methyl-accepting protein methylase
MAVVPTINDIREITPVLSKKLKIDYYGFALSFLRRRFAYVFNVLNVKSTSSFIEDINNENILEEFCYHFPVCDTEIFRDPSFWRTLRTKILPKVESNKLSFWFPDLASNEELFSLLVILKEENLIDQATIYCNVTSKKREEELSKGIASGKSLEISKQNFKRLELKSNFKDFFTYDEGTIYIDKSLLAKIQIIQGNFFCQGPQEPVSLIIYRNRMIYFNLKLRHAAENELHKYLNKDGFFAVGIKEQISEDNNHLFEIFDSNEQIYKV